VQVVLADPNGSSLFHKVKYGVCYTPHQSEKSVKKHRYDSIVEGVGLDRLTNNFVLADIDAAMKISDQELLETAHWLLKHEGLFVGSSSALNVAVACRQAAILGHGHTIVTIICDNGQRHMSRLWNPDYVGTYGLTWPDICSSTSSSTCTVEDSPWSKPLPDACTM
jgi:cysteine synthase A